MNKKDIKYYILIAIIILGLFIFELQRPKVIDWRVTLDNSGKNPYSTYVLFNTLKDIFPQKKLKNRTLLYINILNIKN